MFLDLHQTFNWCHFISTSLLSSVLSLFSPRVVAPKLCPSTLSGPVPDSIHHAQVEKPRSRDTSKPESPASLGLCHPSSVRSPVSSPPPLIPAVMNCRASLLSRSIIHSKFCRKGDPGYDKVLVDLSCRVVHDSAGNEGVQQQVFFIFLRASHDTKHFPCIVSTNAHPTLQMGALRLRRLNNLPTFTHLNKREAVACLTSKRAQTRAVAALLRLLSLPSRSSLLHSFCKYLGGTCEQGQARS